MADSVYWQFLLRLKWHEDQPPTAVRDLMRRDSPRNTGPDSMLGRNPNMMLVRPELTQPNMNNLGGETSESIHHRTLTLKSRSCADISRILAWRQSAGRRRRRRPCRCWWRRSRGPRPPCCRKERGLREYSRPGRWRLLAPPATPDEIPGLSRRSRRLCHSPCPGSWSSLSLCLYWDCLSKRTEKQSLTLECLWFFWSSPHVDGPVAEENQFYRSIVHQGCPSTCKLSYLWWKNKPQLYICLRVVAWIHCDIALSQLSTLLSKNIR